MMQRQAPNCELWFPRFRSRCRTGLPRTGACWTLGICGAAVAGVLGGLGLLRAAPPEPKANPTAKVPAKRDSETQFRTVIAPFVKKHCLECHGPDVQEGDIAFDRFQSVASLQADQKTWQRALEMLRSGAMPPEDAEQPSERQRREVVHAIEQAIYQIDCDEEPDPGRVTIRRLNRAEYNNTVRDLLGVKFRPADDFPSDDVGGGFDNIGDVLTLPPLLMEKYLAAAERIAEEAIVTDTSMYVKTQFRDRGQLRGEGAAQFEFDSRRWTVPPGGGVVAEFEIPRAGQYTLRAFARARGPALDPPRLELRLDGQKVKVFDVNAVDTGGRYEIKWQAEKGTRQLSAHNVSEVDGPAGPPRNFILSAFEMDGPLDIRPEDYPATHQMLIAVRPEGRPVSEAARANLEPLLVRAFRRPPRSEELDRYVRLVTEAVAAGDSFEQGMQVALTAVLVSPQFLFRAEGLGAKAAPGEIYSLNDYELASRLSYFLWSSMPDDALFAAAAAGKLTDPSVLEAQVVRMLADPKSAALVENFATQWLNLRLLDGVAPDPKVFPQFDAQLKAAMRRETELFFAAVIREDRSVLDFLEGRFTYINGRLARHYGIEGIRGDEFQRVEFADQPRTGVLTQGSILTLTSNPGRTSPVKRGKWIMENILGTPPPDPPPDAPDLDATQKSQPNLPLRKQLEIHRQNAVCASCHKVMDQLGFGLENFDAVGRWREKDGPFAVDSSGELPGGARFQGPLELARVLDKRRGEFVRCLTEKLLTFALGRELRVQDRCAVDKIVEQVESREYRFSALVQAIVASDPFQKRRQEGGQP